MAGAPARRELDLPVVMIDCVHFRDRVIMLANGGHRRRAVPHAAHHLGGQCPQRRRSSDAKATRLLTDAQPSQIRACGFPELGSCRRSHAS